MLRISLKLFISLCSHAVAKQLQQFPYHYAADFIKTFYFLMLSCCRKPPSTISLPLCCGFYYNFLFSYALMLSQTTSDNSLTIMLRFLSNFLFLYGLMLSPNISWSLFTFSLRLRYEFLASCVPRGSQINIKNNF